MSCSFWIRRKKKAAKLKAESVAAEKPKATVSKTEKVAEEKKAVETAEKKPVKKAGAKNDNGTDK